MASRGKRQKHYRLMVHTMVQLRYRGASGTHPRHIHVYASILHLHLSPLASARNRGEFWLSYRELSTRPGASGSCRRYRTSRR